MRRLDVMKLARWIRENGEHEAIGRIIARTGLRASVVEKMARGKYPSCPRFLVREALVELTGISMDTLFPKRNEEEVS